MDPNLSSSLQTHFGFDAFRAGQAEAIQSLLNKQHTLAIMPTGAGKSLIYQLAALQLEGLTLVISPLIALMKDQVDALNRKGIPATFINSAIPTAEQNQRLTLLSQGKYRLIYVAPERLRSVTFLRSLQSSTLSLLAVDEAHCVSNWGHDFRPDYLHIAEARRLLGNPLTVALTATATPKVQSDIVHLLGLPEATTPIVTGFNRPNLTLEVKYTADTETKFRTLNELLRSANWQFALRGSSIIYTGTRRDAEEVAEFVRVVCKVQAEHYHAGLSSEDRARIQERFISGSTPVIVATNAFGMGIDRADVRQVIHYSVPGSLEAYYQEAGRAGRDGHPAKAVLLYDPQDRALQEFFIQNSVVTPNELQALYRALGNSNAEVWLTAEDFQRRTDLHYVKIKVGLAALEQIGALEHLGDDGYRMSLKRQTWNQKEVENAAARSREYIRRRIEQLDQMIRYAETNACRRKIILNHFGDHGAADAPVCCDNCEARKSLPAQTTGKPVAEVAQMDLIERAALIILDTARKLGTRQVGREKLAQILKGSKAKDILKFHYDRHVYYAKLAAIQQNQIEEMIQELISLGYFKVVGGEYPVVKLTPKGESALQQKASIPLKLPQGFSKHTIEKKKAQMQAGGTLEYTLQLINQGLTPEQVARQRELTLTTIYSHCAKLIEAGKLDVGKVITNDVKEKIESAIHKVGSTQFLFPIKSILPDEITYEMIRCVVSAQSQTSEVSKPDSISSFLSSSHPRPLKGNWDTGFALDFHSSYKGADWNRSGIGDLVYRLKYESDAAVLPTLIEHTRKLFAAHPEMSQFDTIVPVPSSTPREFSPVHEFCKAISRSVNQPVQTCVIKTRQTQPQKEMHTLPQKRDNVAGAFAVNGDIVGKRILLVDDLFDSGATLEEITRTLRKHGAAKINVLSLTRTIHSDA
ncbi:MAG: RecQ family ATP-dependent DNA helicase [Anaerolineales bacterium]|nr:RecQ family ATP-dependent DNA helicase [Anaerolineales bacterium]